MVLCPLSPIADKEPRHFPGLGLQSILQIVICGDDYGASSEYRVADLNGVWEEDLRPSQSFVYSPN